MFKQVALAIAFVAVLGATGLGMSNTAKASHCGSYGSSGYSNRVYRPNYGNSVYYGYRPSYYSNYGYGPSVSYYSGHGNGSHHGSHGHHGHSGAHF